MNDEGAAARACPLDGDPIEVATAPLPADIGRYARKHTRYPVDWAATLELTSGVAAVRVRDVSASGAGVETAMKLRVGDSGVLHLDQLSGHPAATVVVKNIVPASDPPVGSGIRRQGADPAPAGGRRARGRCPPVILIDRTGGAREAGGVGGQDGLIVASIALAGLACRERGTASPTPRLTAADRRLQRADPRHRRDGLRPLRARGQLRSRRRHGAVLLGRAAAHALVRACRFTRVDPFQMGIR